VRQEGGRGHRGRRLDVREGLALRPSRLPAGSGHGKSGAGGTSPGGWPADGGERGTVAAGSMRPSPLSGSAHRGHSEAPRRWEARLAGEVGVGGQVASESFLRGAR